jgi:hypothetical protein
MQNNKFWWKWRNVKIDEDLKEVEIQINPRIYGLEAVKKTSKIFSKVCRPTIITDLNGTYVFLKPKKGVKLNEIMGYEFYNHLLNVVKEMKTGD